MNQNAKNDTNQLLPRLGDHLRGGDFRPGDRLPSERELAEKLGVGRAALRPALRALETQGILVRKPQSGTFLVCVPSAPVAAAVAAATKTVAVIAPLLSPTAIRRETDPSWLHRVISAFERTVRPADLRILLRNQSESRDDPCSVKQLAREAADNCCAAAVLLHPLGGRATIACALALLHDQKVHPIIVSARSYSGLASQVYFDSSWGAYLATRCLLRQGHRRIGFAGAPSGHEWVQERLAAYRTALETAEIVPEEHWVYLPDEGERLPIAGDGAAALNCWQRLPENERPTGVVAANDVIALGLLERARTWNLAIPGDYALVGFDNDPGALVANLTTVERPTEALGEAVARVTLERLAGLPDADTVTLRLRPVLIERGTVGAPRES